MLNLNTVMLGSENPSALVECYTKVFGEPQWNDESYTGWQVGSANFMIGPHSEVHGSSKEPGRLIVNFETPDVKAEFERIKGLGVTVQQEPYQPGPMPEGVSGEFWLATFADPDGNFFQLASPMPEGM